MPIDRERFTRFAARNAMSLHFSSLVAVVSFDGLGHAAGVSLSYLGLATIEGQIVQPLLVGRRLEVNPLLIFLGLWFGGFFWGIAGVILATQALRSDRGGTALLISWRNSSGFRSPAYVASAAARPVFSAPPAHRPRQPDYR